MFHFNNKKTQRKIAAVIAVLLIIAMSVPTVLNVLDIIYSPNLYTSMKLAVTYSERPPALYTCLRRIRRFWQS